MTQHKLYFFDIWRERYLFFLSISPNLLAMRPMMPLSRNSLLEFVVILNQLKNQLKYNFRFRQIQIKKECICKKRQNILLNDFLCSRPDEERQLGNQLHFQLINCQIELKIKYTINKTTYPQRNSKMDISDFDNTYKYKFFLPMLYVVNWALMLTGPFFYPAAYQMICMPIFILMGLKTIQTSIWTVVAAIRGFRYLAKAKKLLENKKPIIPGQQNQTEESSRLRQSEIIENPSQIKKELFAFIIPSYKEDPELLGQTLMHLAIHSDAKKRYLVFLAMEAHEQGSIQKAKQLIAKYGKYFKVMSYSHHTIREFQQKGKASNVSWCGENLEEHEFKKHGIDPNDVYLTVIDADSWVPEIYVVEVQERIQSQYELRHKTIFEPAQMYTRNHESVPITTRVYDISHGGLHFANLVGCFEDSFPLSNYTLSFNLIKKIGFWDTCGDAIGQDFHTTIKAFWKTNGDVRTVDLHIPFNQVNVETGKGYWQDVMARFWQAERHARGCADAAYVLKMLFSKPFNWRTWVVSYNVLECFILPTLIPWAAAGNFLCNVASMFLTQPDYIIDVKWIDAFFNFATLNLIFTMLVYYYFVRKASKILYGLDSAPLWRAIQFPIFFLLTLFAMTVPTFVIAAFKVMLNKNEYNTAEKKISFKGQQSSLIQNVEKQSQIKV